MKDHTLSISLDRIQGPDLQKITDLPSPDQIDNDTSVYIGQRNVENLLKSLNRKVYRDSDENLLPFLFEIFEKSIEHGVEDTSTVQWDDRSHYTRISWTGYSWKLPKEMKKRKINVRITKMDESYISREFKVSLSKIANDGGDILIAPRIVSNMNLKKGNPVMVGIKFSE